MKKLFSIVLIAVLSLGFAKAQTVLFTEDFHAGINPAWGNSGTALGNPNPYVRWKYTHLGSQGAYDQYPAQDTIISPTSYNGWIIFDSDSLDNGGHTLSNGQPNTAGGPANAPQYVALTTTAIDVTGNPYCVLNFHQYYRNFQSTTVVGISIDSVNWTLDTVNASVAVNAATAQNSQITVDLSPVINSVSPASNKVYVSFIMDANYYFWQIDDINVTTLPNNELSVVSSGGESGSSGLNLFYSQIPASEADSFFAVTTYGNIGRDPQPNTIVDFQFFKNGSLLANDTSAPPVGILNYGVDTFGYAELYTQGIGQYIVASTVTSDSVNFGGLNVDTFGFAVTDTVFSINTTTFQNASSYFLLRNDYGYSFRLGTLYELDNADTVTSVTTAVAGGTEGTHAGAVLQASIYAVTFTGSALQYNSTSPIITTYPKTLAAGDITDPTSAQVTPVTMTFNNASGNAVLPAGLYWVAIGALSTPDSNVLLCSTNYQTNGFPVVEQNSTLYYLSSTDAAYCGLNFGHDASLLYANWTRNPSTNPVRVNNNITFTGLTNGDAQSTYSWVMTGKNTGTVYNATGKVIHQVFGIADTFSVCLTVTDGGSSAEYCNNVNVANPVGISEITALDNVSMVPNPSTGMVTLSASDINGSVSISIVNLLGETVENFNGTSNGAFTKTFNLSELTNGIYLVKISNDGNSVTKKLSISK